MSGTFADFLTALGKNESGNNYGFVSSLGYLGRYQFGEEALKAVGFYNGDDGTGAIDFVGGWTAKAASFGVFDKATFLASPAAQDAAATAWFANIDGDLNALGLGKYEGATLNGLEITGSGLLAASHLVGVWAVKAFLESGGFAETRDGYGTPLTEYLTRFGGFDTPFTFSHDGAETLAGGSGADVLRPGGGDDAVAGGAGFDIINGNTGDDTVAGGADNDWVSGGQDNDRVYGDDGADILNGNLGNDTVDGGTGADIVRGGQGDDSLAGGSGNDWLSGDRGADNDWVSGGQDNDRVYGDDGADILNGNLGNDTVDGGTGADIVRGGQGDDSLAGGAGNDWLSGDRGSDTLVGGAGADTFHSFADGGLDRILDFNAAEGDRVQLDAGTHYSLAQVGADTVIDLGGGAQTVLVGVQLSSLSSGWLFEA